jgi:hypothetical protein
MSFDVACSSEHAFSMWTARIGSWWPPDHTVSAEADVAVVLQAGVGGRIYERTPDGREHDWGEITAWEPPARWPTFGISAAPGRTPPRWRFGSSRRGTLPPVSKSSTAGGTAGGMAPKAGVIAIGSGGRRCCRISNSRPNE